MTRREQIQKIRSAINPRYIKSVLMDLCVFNRWTTSDDMIAAAEKAVELMGQVGLETNLYTYTNKEEYILETPNDMGWNFWQVKEGWCEIADEEGRKIADYRADPMSIGRLSVGCDYRENPVEVVYMDRGPDEANYDDIDFTGKVIFVKDGIGESFRGNEYTRWAIGKRGAVGMLISAVSSIEGFRGKWNQYETIGWSTCYPGSFTFATTPKEGDRLERIILEKRAKGESLYLRCFLDVDTTGENKMSNAEGIIRGTEEGEDVLLYAHLCHARPSVNDNLSGCGAVLSAMYALNDLITRGVLPRPKRTIRGIVGPEMNGSAAEIFRKNKENTARAVFSMDMVGAQQGPVGVGPIYLADAPRSTPNITYDIAAFCMEEVSKDITNYGVEWVCTHNMTHTSYSAGSDPDMWADPAAGAPCAYTGQWPDRFYHSTSDDISAVDPTLIARSAAMSAAYAYIIATLEVEDLPLFMAKGCENMTRTIVRNGFDGDEQYYLMTMHHFRDFYLAGCDQYPTYFEGEDRRIVEEKVEAQKKRIATIIDNTVDTVLGRHVDLSDYPVDGSDLPAEYQYVPAKTFIGRVFDLEGLCERKGCSDVYKEYMRNYGRTDFQRSDMVALFYINGERTLAECMTRAALDRRVKNREELVKALHEYCKVFMACGVMSVK